MQQRKTSQHLGIQPVGLGVLVVVIPQVRRLLRWHQDDRGTACLEPGRSGTQALRVGSRMTVTDESAGILAHRRSRSVVVVRNFHDDQMNSPRSSARLARWSARQATSMLNLTSLMAWSCLRVVDQSALRRRPVHVPQGCDHPDIQKQGSDSMIGRRVPEKGCTCVGRLVWSTITVEESSSRSLRPP
jgi:hypothetical protein